MAIPRFSGVVTRFAILPAGIRYMVLSALGFSLMAACVKLTAQRGIPALEIVAARALVSLLISTLDVRRKGIPLLGGDRFWLLARGVVGTVALVFVYYAITVLPLAEATVIQFLHPAFTALLALVFLNERIHRSTMVSIALSFAGLLLVVQPGFLFGGAGQDLPQAGLIAALLGALGSGVAYVIVRKLSQTEDPSVIVLYFPLVALPVSLLLLGDDFVTPTGSTWLLLLLVGVFTQVGQVGLTKAMQTEAAGKAMAYAYIQVIFAVALGWLLFDELPGAWSASGAALIIIGSVVNLLWRRSY